MSDDLVKRYLLIKRGLYYAPDRQGYTGVKERAGRYREVEALGLDGVTAIHEDEAPDFSPACWGDTKIAVLTARIEALTAEVERLRGALEQIAEADYGYMDIIESGAPPEKHADYFCSMVNWRRMTARAALAGDSHDQ